jgi:hypothetical protein
VGGRNFSRPLFYSSDHVDPYIGATLGTGKGFGHPACKRSPATDFRSGGSARASADDDVTARDTLAASSSNQATIHRAKTVS